MKKLIRTTEFVMWISDKEEERPEGGKRVPFASKCYSACRKYVAFISLRLDLSMFVPCDENGVRMEEPDLRGLRDGHRKELTDRYQKALKGVLFKGFEIIEGQTQRVVRPGYANQHRLLRFV